MGQVLGARQGSSGPFLLLAFLLPPAHRIVLRFSHAQGSEHEVPFPMRRKYQITPAQLVLFNAAPHQDQTRDPSIVSEVDTDFAIDSVEMEKTSVKVARRGETIDERRLRLEISPGRVGQRSLKP
jgi:hypothetical protein